MLVSKAHLAASGGRARAVVTNSGCANACTGPQGLADAREMAALTAAALGLRARRRAGRVHRRHRREPEDGGAAHRHPARPWRASARRRRGRRRRRHHDHRSVPEVGGRRGRRRRSGTFRVGGMAKGSGMIEPRMATMLGYLTTDAAVAPDRLQRVLTEACRYTFNAITVDGEPSTNDCVFALASGASGVAIDDATEPALFEALPGRRPGAGPGHRARRRGRHQAGRDHRQRRRQRRRCVDGGAGHGQLAAGEDGDPRRRSELGPAGGRGRALRARRSCSTRPGSASARWCSSPTGRPFDDLAPQAANYLQGTDLDIEVGLGTGGGCSRHRLDVRSLEGVRPHQRRVPDLAWPSDTFSRSSTSRPTSSRSASSWRPALREARRRRPHAVPEATALAGRQIGLLFEKPSLRTRVTFTIGVGELGGDVVDIPSDVMHADREPLHDVARNLERWVDARGDPHLRPGAAVDLHRVGAGPAGRQRAVGRGASVPGAGRHADAHASAGARWPAARWPSSATATTWRRRWSMPG